MPIEAYLVAVGQYSGDLVDVLDDYGDVPEGTRVIVPAVFTPCVSSSQSREFAISLGTEVYDYKSHKIDPSKVKFDELLEALSRSMSEEFVRDEIEEFKLLVQKGFEFFFVPG